ncbi:MAG: hypothetical protein ACI4AQ_06375 [Lachnospiraceae bacterium]
MGMDFNNIHIRKNEKYDAKVLKQALVEWMKNKGYEQVQSTDDCDVTTVIYDGADSPWVSVSSDIMQYKDAEDVGAQTEFFSSLFQTDVLAAACYDSDYLWMNYVNVSDDTDAWVNVGRVYGMKKLRPSKLSSWKNKVTDYKQFSAIMRGKYVLAEEALYSAAPLIGMKECQVCLDSSVVDDLEIYGIKPGDLEPMYFVLEEKEGTEKELPKLQATAYYCAPWLVGETYRFDVYNLGGKSKGIGVLFYGDYVENDELTFEDVALEWDIYVKNGTRKSIPITLEKVKLNDGTTGLYWEDRDFRIPEKVNKDLPFQQYLKKLYSKEFGVRFTVQGNPKKVLDIKIVIIPLENPENGQECWYAYRLAGSKEEFIQQAKADGNWERWGMDR